MGPSSRFLLRGAIARFNSRATCCAVILRPSGQSLDAMPENIAQPVVADVPALCEPRRRYCPPASNRTRPCATLPSEHRIRGRKGAERRVAKLGLAADDDDPGRAFRRLAARRGRQRQRGDQQQCGETAHRRAFNRNDPFSKHLDICLRLYYLDNAVTSPESGVRAGRRWRSGTGSGRAAEFRWRNCPTRSRPNSPPIDESEAERPPKRRRWPIVLYALSGLMFLTIAWLVITAPLSRALEPLDDPALLMLSATTAIRSRGAARSRKRRSTPASSIR